MPRHLGMTTAKRTGMSSTQSVESTPPLLPLTDVKRSHILRVLDACLGNRTKAAEILRIDRKTLYRQLKTYGV